MVYTRAAVGGQITASMYNEHADELRAYVWPDQSARDFQTGMVKGELGYQQDTDTTYRYSGSAWALWSKPLVSYAPTFTANPTNPTLGTGGAASGSYQITDGAVRGNAEAIFGTAGAAQGSGTYLIGLPVAATSLASVRVIGSAYIRDASDGYKSYLGTVVVSESTATSASIAVGGFTFAGAGAPIIFTNNDQIFLDFCYSV